MATFGDAMLVQPAGAPLTTRALRIPPRVLLWAALRGGLRLRVEGERTDGPAVVVSNHPHVVDGLVVLLADPRLRPIARWHRVALLRAGMWVADCLVTTTGTPVRPHRGAYADALAHLRVGGRVWIAPEGGVQREETLRYPRTGAVRLAHEAGVPIQVLAVAHERPRGPDLAVWRTRRRPGITLRWGGVVQATGDVPADIDRMMAALAVAAAATWTPDRRRWGVEFERVPSPPSQAVDDQAATGALGDHG